MRIGWKAAVHDLKIASFRYRVAEPVAALSARGHVVEVFTPERADAYELVVFSKSYRAAEQALARSIKARGGRVVLDLCDNHFYNPYRLPRYEQARVELLAMIGLADRVVTSTPALARIVQAEAGLAELPVVVGDAAERLILPEVTQPPGRTLLWFGSHGSPNAPSGMNDLLGIADVLAQQHARTPLELVVASNDPAKFTALAPKLEVPSHYVPWTAEGFPALLASADGVVIPLSDNPFVAAKTHNRLTLALWAGVPVVADAIESYREFAAFAWLDDWAAGLRTICENNDAARARAAGARAYIDAHWSMAQIAPAWERALGLSAPEERRATPSTEPAVALVRTPRYQGALDPAAPAALTGWARAISDPSRAVTVSLEADGRVVASALADRPRSDLAAAGFRQSECGFELAVPADWQDGASRRFAVRVDGVQTIEEGTAVFRDSGSPSRPASPSRAIESALASVVAASEHSIFDAADGKGAPDTRMQARLADELAGLNDAIEQVRRIAARIVLAAGEGPPPHA